MRTVAIFTTSRAEFGIFTPLIRAIEKKNDVAYKLFVGGTHLASEYGWTIQEVQDQDFKIADTFDYLLNSDTSAALAKSSSIATYELANLFQKHDFDFVCLAGDRFELLAIVTTAILFKKPLIHLHGGEKTEGVIDEQIRHMVTKAAHLHFVACDDYALNVMSMGEPAWRVHNTGALAIDNIASTGKVAKCELFERLNLDEGRQTILLTYHPVTLEFEISATQQMKNVFAALEKYDLQVLVTSPNVEIQREKIVTFLKEEISKNDNYHYVDSLGINRFHSIISYCQFVIGNSSSGILEVPFFRVPTVNIGDRQKGRIRHESVIDTDYSVDSIRKGIEKALSGHFQKTLIGMPFKFGDGSAGEKMVEIIRKVEIDQDFLRKSLEFTN